MKDARQELITRIRLFERGVICPSEMWWGLFCELSASDVDSFLNDLEPSLQEFLLGEYAGEAEYRFQPEWYSKLFEQERVTLLKIGRWCESRLDRGRNE